MSKLFGIHYSNSDSGVGYAIVNCKNKNDAVKASGLYESIVEINEIVELDRSNYTSAQWQEAVDRAMKKQGII